MAQPQLVLKRKTAQNHCYDEALADRVLPLRMMQIPAGTFLMGSPENELERQESEGPQHEVTLSQFFMGKYPITQAQWRAVAALPQVERELQAAPSSFKGDLRPVEQVSWHDAVEFCDRLTILTNRQYRLPTEAEWEYACRANPIRTVSTPEVWQVKLSEQSTPFHFGETISSELANYDVRETYGDGPKGEYREGTTPVNQFEGANAFGLCDMHGNVWEWCQDYWHNNYEGAPTDGSAWIKGGDSDLRILRGGSWIDLPRNCRSAFRDFYGPGYDFNDVGFRVVCSAPRIL
jgi:formylglycine-generating enzyme required for sulfatase activity